MICNSPMRRLAMGVLMLVGWAVPWASGDTTNYLVNGQLASETLGSEPAGINGASFELWLAFDEPTLPDPDRSTFATPTLTYIAQAWSLAYFRNGDIVAETNQDDSPEAVAFAVMSGGLTGLDDGETFLNVGVDAGPASSTDILNGTLIDVDFYTPTLVDAFFTDRLVDVPSDFALTSGSAFDAARSQGIDITDAALSAVSTPDAVIIDPDGLNSGSPSAVPSPTAVAGGALLLIGVMSRRRRAALDIA